jgi:FMN hydrolase / 5-amino-6-(5-phospho-D-ribitylamino)uracil phosphatase
MLDPSRLRAITLDLDDTLWPVMPTIERAEAALQAWLRTHAPATATYLQDEQVRRTVRQQVNRDWAHMAHDFSCLRREAIRLALRQAGDDTALAEPAFEVFFEQRQQVTLFDDVLPALQALSQRFPLVALSNGNADVQRVGLGHCFTAQVSARAVGVAKPDPRVVAAAAAAAGVACTEVLHIGDDPGHDVQGALGAGMQAVWVNRQGQPWADPLERPHLTVSDLGALCDRLLAPLSD